ncbi:MAG: N-acetylmuramoyl-L-alanine amidase [Balneolaceae bacterium]|nr:MAG: N-acetylmuramoyl-L-alanine amidase [Balneolaceae bacterium]
MERISILTIILVTVVLSFCLNKDIFAQPNLERISISERSDGKGFVIRNHLTATPDSFKITQPSSDLIQFMIYSDKLDAADFIKPDLPAAIRNIEYQKNDAGFGFDIFLEAGNYFRSSAYHDRNAKHILIGLERATKEVVDQITANSDFIYWYDYHQDSFAFDFRFSADDDAFIQMRNNNGFNVIVLDPGHGGHDPGAVNRSLGIREKDIALAVALKVGDYINEHMPDVKVVYTRKDDRFVELARRGKIASEANGDLFISIHVNSARSPQAHGAEIYFLGLARTASALEVMKRENSVIDLENGGGPMQLSEEELLIFELANAGNLAISERIAMMMEDQFRNRAQRRSRGVKQAGFMVLWNLPMPALLIELGFLTNTNEARYMASDYGQTILASAIFRAIRDFKQEYDRSSRQTNNRASND